MQEILRAGLCQQAEVLRVPVLRIAVEEHAADKGREVVHLQIFPDSGGHSDVDSVGVGAPYAYAETRECGEIVLDEELARKDEIVIDVAVEPEHIIVDVNIEPKRS